MANARLSSSSTKIRRIVDWRTELDLSRAIGNLRSLAKGDWYRDPWGWPEYQHLLDTAGDAIWKKLRRQHALGAVSHIEVPKENFGVRPAVQLDISDHVIYQMLVDSVSTDALSDIRPDVFGWRHPPIGTPKPGRYASNKYQWRNYRSRLSRLADSHEHALRTDVTSFFASIPIPGVIDDLSARTGKIEVINRIEAMLEAWNARAHSGGLPQRSQASSVLANMYMQHADELLAEYAVPDSKRARKTVRSSFTRWMDDIWLFRDDQGALRAAQVDLQRELHSMGLVLNSGKTEVLEGNAMRAKAKKAYVSAVDDAFIETKDSAPLEELIDRILDDKEVADGTTVKFVSTRMRRWGIDYRVSDLLAAAERFPHAADSLARLFRRQIRTGEMQEWYLEYLISRWNCFEWASAQFGTAIPSARRPQRATVNAFRQLLGETATSLPGVALAAQRLSDWSPRDARGLIGDRITKESNPLMVRTLALSALQAGERSTTVRKWLRPFPETQLTAQMLAARGFAPLKVVADYL
jgi:hypothetical protein